MGVPHMLQQYVPVLELLRAYLAREGRTLSAIESEVATERLLLQVRLLAPIATVSDAFVVEHLQFRVFFEVGSVENDSYKITINHYEFKKFGVLTKVHTHKFTSNLCINYAIYKKTGQKISTNTQKNLKQQST